MRDQPQDAAAGASCVALACLGCCVQQQLRPVAAGAACDNSLRWRWAGGAALSVAFCKMTASYRGTSRGWAFHGTPGSTSSSSSSPLSEPSATALQKRVKPQCPCPVCPPLCPRSVDRGRSFDLSRLPTADEASAMVVCALGHVGFNTALFSGISARRGGLSTAIEVGVPEAILWMQSGHA
jgi:hypothetical protein